MELEITCRDCTNLIEAYVGAFDILTPEKVAELMEKAYGRVLCQACRGHRSILPRTKKARKGGN